MQKNVVLSTQATDILSAINQPNTKLGDLRKWAKDIKKNHELALELWSTKSFFARMLSILIMGHKVLSQDVLDELTKAMEQHSMDERTQLMDWLMANQLTKNKKTIALMESWVDRPLNLQRRIYWYYQGRLRWVGQTPPANSEELLSLIEKRIVKEAPEVQWAMNFTAAQIGIFQQEFRNRCIAIGEETGLYKDEMVAKNCTPNYLPKYIEMQVAKLNK